MVSLTTVPTGKETETFVSVPSATGIEWLQSFLDHFHRLALNLGRIVEQIHDPPSHS
jgi:hypothetical protein